MVGRTTQPRVAVIGDGERSQRALDVLGRAGFLTVALPPDAPPVGQLDLVVLLRAGDAPAAQRQLRAPISDQNTVLLLIAGTGAAPPEPDAPPLYATATLATLVDAVGDRLRPALPLRAVELGRVGRLELVRRLGEGGMGVVYEAHDPDFGRTVAVKMLPPHRVPDAALLKAEFRAAAELNHPNLVSLYELIEHEGVWHFTMEMVDGVDILTALKGASEPCIAHVLGQLCCAARALHRSGLLHLDIKPDNVLVEPSGRVVLLDFGISRRLDDGAGGVVHGTLHYLAPELLAHEAPTTAADWYSVGATLFHLLTDLPPWGRQMDEVDRLLSGCPDRLARLCSALLRRDPTDRAGWEACRVALDLDEPAVRLPLPLVGRQAERAQLDAAWAGAALGRSAVVLIRGPSGVGKTALVADFAASIGAAAFSGRCFEREQIPFRALDGVLDALINHLVRSGTQRSHANLAVLSELAAIRPELAPVGRGGGASVPPRQQLARARAALRDLLLLAADGGPLLICIDDVQWGDVDSARLLSAAVAEVPGLLVLGTWLEGAADLPADQAPAFVDALRERVATEVLPLGPLTDRDSRALVEALGSDPSTVAASIESARGNPYFLRALVDHGGQADTVEDLVLSAQEQLTEPQRWLLHLVALAGRRVPLEVLDAAVGGSIDPVAAVTALTKRQLLRAEGMRRTARVECWHNRVQTSVTSTFSPATLRALHGDLARGYEATDAGTADLLAQHYYGAGEVDRAVSHREDSAREARERLAFSEAADQWQEAVRWARELLESEERVKARQLRLADALVLSGRRVEAAECQLALCAESPDHGLLGAAAGHLMASGRVERGRALLAPLLRRSAVRWPSGARSTMASIAVELARTALIHWRGFPACASAREAERAHLCWLAARGLLPTDPLAGFYFSARGLRSALCSGDPQLEGRLLAVMGSVFLAPAGGRLARWGQSLLERAAELALRHPDSLLPGVVEVGRCQERALAGDWIAVRAHASKAHAHLNSRVTASVHEPWRDSADVAWELDVATMGALRAEEELGYIDQATHRARVMAEAAREVGNLYGEVTGLVYEGIGRVALGEIGRAREIAERARALWAFPGFHIQHFYAMRIELSCALHEGQAHAARARLEAHWLALQKSGLLSLSLVAFDGWELRSRLARATGDEAAAQRWARKLISRPEPFCVLWGRGLLAEGDELLSVADALDAADMPARAACLRWVGGDRARAEPVLRRAGVADPGRWAALMTGRLGDDQARVQHPR